MSVTQVTTSVDTVDMSTVWGKTPFEHTSKTPGQRVFRHPRTRGWGGYNVDMSTLSTVWSGSDQLVAAKAARPDPPPVERTPNAHVTELREHLATHTTTDAEEATTNE